MKTHLTVHTYPFAFLYVVYFNKKKKKKGFTLKYNKRTKNIDFGRVKLI